MPVLVLLLGALLAASTAGLAQLRCIDAARAGARAAARHEDPRPVALAAGPDGASVQVTASGDLVTVRVSAEVELPLPWHPRIGVESASTAQTEEEVGR